MSKPLFFLNFEIFILRNPMRMSKNETTQARLIAETLDLTLHARPGFRNFLVPNFQSWESCEVIANFPYCWILIWLYVIYKRWVVFLASSVLFHFSKFRSLAFDLPCFLWTKIYINRPNQTTDLYSLIFTLTAIFLIFFCKYPQCYITNDLNLGFNE